MIIPPLRVAVIGAGEIAQRGHLPGYVKAGAQVVALCDNTRPELESVAAQYQITRLYRDYHQMLADGGFEAVSVCTPPYLHSEMAVECARHGFHVLVEKPMALTLEQCDQMIAAAKTAGVRLMVSQNQRFMAQHRKAKEIHDSGVLGELYLVHSVFGHGGPENWTPTYQWYFTPLMAGLGVCADLGIHKIDLVRWITGQEVAWISAFNHTFEKPTSLEDTAVMSLQLSGGTLATIQITWAYHPDWQNSLVLHGERGAIYVPTEASEPVRLLSDKEALYPCPTDDPSGWFGSLKAFVSAVQNDKPVPVPGREGRASMAAILAASQSAAERTVVRPA